MSDQSPTIAERLRADALARAAEFDAGKEAAKQMPAALRARLHEEIGRQRQVSAASAAPAPAWNFSQFISSFWPRFAVAATAIVLLALVVLPRSQREADPQLRSLASNSAGEIAATAPALAPMPSPTAALREEVAAAPAPPVNVPSAVAEPSSQLSDNTSRADSALAGAAASNMVATRSQNFSRAAVVNSAPSTATRARAAAKPAAASSSRETPVPEVLTNFRLEQTGDRIRVVDADGSVYEGEVHPLAAGESAKAAAPQQSAAKDNNGSAGQSGNRTAAVFAKRRSVELDAASPQETQPTPSPRDQQVQNDAAATAFSFRATGANRSLQKPVVFEGTYFAAPENNAVNDDKNSSAQQAEQRQNASRNATPDARVVGRVQVNGREIPIDASAVGP